ncbi:MAG: Fur family transcriptional regulator [Candidatus Omnitrophota bacterium]
MKNQKEFTTSLKKHFLKVTPKREAVIDLFSRRKDYLSPQEVWAILRKKFDQVGLPTTYRILEELSSIGLLFRIESSDQQLYYGFCRHEDRAHHHHHFICRKCHSIIELSECLFEHTEKILRQKLKCKPERHIFQVEGLCAKCR